MIVIVDYGMGNLGSIKNMVNKIGSEAVITSEHNLIETAEKIILPGVGAFDAGMSNLAQLNLIPLLNKKVLEEKIPVLGICLGMQLFSNNSEEGKLAGLKWIDAETVRFNFTGENLKLKIPHMGWNTVKLCKQSKLTSDIGEEPRFYFVHSYHVQCRNDEDALLKTFYGIEFTSALQKGNIYGVQFHPEKSHKFGMQLLKNFIELN
jgi:glutamine amidotransferase